jgi:hypothetical protein
VEALLTGTVLYLYGLVPAGVDITGLAAVEEGSDIFLVVRDGIACIASAVPASAYQCPAGASTAAAQLEWVTPRACRHHDVLQRLHRTGTVVPLKFGTLCADAAQVQALLEDHHGAVVALLAQFAGKDEWTLNILVDETALSAALQRDDPDLVRLAEEERCLPEGRAYFARKKLQTATAERVEELRAHVGRAVLERLCRLGIEIALGHDAAAPPALLVERARFAELEAALDELEQAHASAFVRFELVGPWPPYSFTTTMGAP